VAADIADPQGRRAVVAACASGVAGLVNNAGVNHFALLQDQSDDGVRQMFEVNVIAPILLVRDLLPALKLEDGFIVNVGSGFGAVGFPGYSAYSASKFALRGFTEALRRELADTRVGVLYLAPRATDTGMNPPEVVALNRDLGNTTDPPERVADELLALIRKGKGCRAIGWRERFFARLNGLFPSLVDAALKKQLPGIRRSALAAAERGA
jgi:short-subunit dehydrogenase